MKAKSILASIVAVLFAVGCGSGDDTNGTGTADSGNEMQLTFDGDSCVGAMPSDCSRTASMRARPNCQPVRPRSRSLTQPRSGLLLRSVGSPATRRPRT